MRIFAVFAAAVCFFPSVSDAAESRETIVGWTLEERRNPAEPRGYSIRLSKAAGLAELVAKRSAIKGREVDLLLSDCSQVAFGNNMANFSVAQQIQSIREFAASTYDSSRKECKLPAMPPALLGGFDEAYRAMDAKFRAGRPPTPSLDRTQKVGRWALQDVKDQSDGSEPGHRLIGLAKSEGDLRLSYTLDVNLFFDSMFFTRNKFVAQYADCRREMDLSSTDKEGPAEAAARKAEVAAALRDLQADCQLPASVAAAAVSDFAPAFSIASGWARKHLFDRMALMKVAEDYEEQLASKDDLAAGAAASAGSGDGVTDAMAAADAAADAADAAEAAAACAVDAATGKADPKCGMMAVSDTCYIDPANGKLHGTKCPADAVARWREERAR